MSIKENKTKFKKEMTYDFDGKPIYIKPINIDILPIDMAIVEYEDSEPILKCKSYQNLNL